MNAKEQVELMRRWAQSSEREGALVDAMLLRSGASAIERVGGGGASVSIAGGLVHGEWEQVKAVQEMILENERLRREAREREDKERPKVTLAEQIEAVAWCSRAHPSSQRNAGKPPIGVTLHHAAATLRRLEEEGPKFAGADVIFQSELASWLKSLGVEARKP